MTRCFQEVWAARGSRALPPRPRHRPLALHRSILLTGPARRRLAVQLHQSRGSSRLTYNSCVKLFVCSKILYHNFPLKRVDVGHPGVKRGCKLSRRAGRMAAAPSAADLTEGSLCWAKINGCVAAAARSVERLVAHGAGAPLPACLHLVPKLDMVPSRGGTLRARVRGGGARCSSTLVLHCARWPAVASRTRVRTGGGGPCAPARLCAVED